MTITPAQLEEWKRLAEAATEGPWITKQTVIHGRAYGGLWIEGIDKEDGGELLLQISGSGGARSYTTRVVDTQQHDANDANAAFIAAARTALPALLDEVERLRAEAAQKDDALKPFAEIAERFPNESESLWISVRLSSCRAAQTARKDHYSE